MTRWAEGFMPLAIHPHSQCSLPTRSGFFFFFFYFGEGEGPRLRDGGPHVPEVMCYRYGSETCRSGALSLPTLPSIRR